MLTFDNIKSLQTALHSHKESNKKIGFVPTMGALHEGHLSLLKKAKEECEVVVVSIFVNPTQFNNPEDLEKYPRTEAIDIKLLEKEGCDIVFLPKVDEIYPKDCKTLKLDLSPLNEVMEGKHRPGHFEGVVNVVSRFFEIVQPNKAYFGRKDFQQVAIIRKMNKQLNFPIEIVSVETERSPSGLALSSRNARLNEEQLEKATAIYRTLIKGKTLVESNNPKATKRKMEQYFSQSGLQLEYIEIVNPDNLLSLNQYWVPGATACIVAYCDDVRLIDNMELVPND
ncbi:MAG: pantoate--beta-alanine ligase [Brumimicrobium sp.]